MARGPRQLPIKDKKVRAALDYIRGMLVKDILYEHSISARTLYKFLEEADIPLRQKHPRRDAEALKRARQCSGEHIQKAREALAARNPPCDEEFADIWLH
jgi:hypothetical protein